MFFYTVCAFITMLNKTDALYMNLAWAFLLFRVGHAVAFLAGMPRVRAVIFTFSLTAMAAMYLRLFFQL